MPGPEKALVGAAEDGREDEAEGAAGRCCCWYWGACGAW